MSATWTTTYQSKTSPVRVATQIAQARLSATHFVDPSEAIRFAIMRLPASSHLAYRQRPSSPIEGRQHR